MRARSEYPTGDFFSRAPPSDYAEYSGYSGYSGLLAFEGLLSQRLVLYLQRVSMPAKRNPNAALDEVVPPAETLSAALRKLQPRLLKTMLGGDSDPVGKFTRRLSAVTGLDGGLLLVNVLAFIAHLVCPSAPANPARARPARARPARDPRDPRALLQTSYADAPNFAQALCATA